MDEFTWKQFLYLRTSSVVQDVTFTFDGEELKANRALLASSCPYFETMLYGNTNEAKQTSISLNDTSKNAFEKVLEFITTADCKITDVDESQLLQLIRLAHEYQLPELLNNLFAKIDLKNFSISFCVELYDTCKICGLEKWKDMCLEVFVAILKNKCDPEIFAKFSKNLVNEIISRDLSLMEEIDLFKHLLKWKEFHDTESSIDLFSKLRLHLISIEDFVKIVMPTDLVDCKSYLRALEKNRVCTTHQSEFSVDTDTAYLVGTGDCSKQDWVQVGNYPLIFTMKQLRCKMDEITFLVMRGDSNFDVEVIDDCWNKVPTSKSVTSRNQVFYGYNWDEYTVTFSPSSLKHFMITSKPNYDTRVIIYLNLVNRRRIFPRLPKDFNSPRNESPPEIQSPMQLTIDTHHTIEFNEEK